MIICENECRIVGKCRNSTVSGRNEKEGECPWRKEKAPRKVGGGAETVLGGAPSGSKNRGASGGKFGATKEFPEFSWVSQNI